MKIFTIYSQKRKNIINDMIFVEEGFCFKAFIFSIFWAIYNKIWWLSSLIFIINLTLIFIDDRHYINSYYVYVLNIFLNIFLGFFGHDIYRMNLKLNNYKLVDIISEENRDKARFRFLKKLSNSQI